VLREEKSAIELQNRRLHEDVKAAGIVQSLYAQAAGELAALKKSLRLHASAEVRQWSISPAADLNWRAVY